MALPSIKIPASPQLARQILVLGATGTVGSHLVRMLSAQGDHIRAATRQPNHYIGPANAVPIHFDLEQPTTFASALVNIDSAFVIPRAGDPKPQETFSLFFNQAKSSGLRHIVFVTAAGVEINPKMSLCQVESLLKQSGLGYTILRPAWFMENFSKWMLRDAIAEDSVIRVPAGHGSTSFIHSHDIACVAAAALNDTCHAGKEYVLTGGEALSYSQVAAIISDVVGRTISYEAVTNDTFRQSLIDRGWSETAAAFRSALYYPVQQGWTEAVSSAVPTILGRSPITFRQFADANAAAWAPAN